MTGFKFQDSLTYFVYTNVWLYAFIQSQDVDKTMIAKQIVTNTDVNLSTQIINEMCVNLIKKASFTEATIRQIITSIYQKYTVLELSIDVFTSASTVREKHSFSYWDSIVAASALNCGADILITEDMQHDFLLDNKLRIVNPFNRTHG